MPDRASRIVRRFSSVSEFVDPRIRYLVSDKRTADRKDG